MEVTQVLQNGDSQLVRLPAGFEFSTDVVGIRREGEAVILEPLRSTSWPANFFESIRIEDRAFERPAQGKMPASPEF